MNKTKLNRLSDIAFLQPGSYLLPDGYSGNVLKSVQYALNYCLMRRQIWLTDDGGIEIVPPNPNSEEARPFEFEMYRKQLYQYLLALDAANELAQSDRKAAHVKADRDGVELSPGFLNHAKRISDTIHGMKFKFDEHPDGGLIMTDKGTDMPLTKRVFNAMKEADEKGRSVMEGISQKIMSVKTYVSSYRHVFPNVSMSTEGRNVVFLKSDSGANDADSYFEKFQGIFKGTEPFKAIPVSIESIPVSNNYFRTRIKAMCEPGMDVLVTIQTGMKRALVTKLPFEWECAMSAESDIIDPEWDDDEWNAPVVAVDDDEAYEDDPDNSDFEIENDEIL